jgi:hypothetical protein
MASPVLISYSWEDMAQIERLEQLLRLRGVPVWRDRPQLGFGALQETEILRVIDEEAAGALIYLTPAALDGGVGFIPKVELPAIHARALRDPEFFFGALFAGYSPGDGQAALHERTGIPIGAAWGIALGDPVEDADLVRAADAVLGAYLTSLPDGALRVRVDTRDAIPLGAGEPLHLAWAPPLAHDVADVPGDAWSGELIPALGALRHALLARRAHELVIGGRAHLSAALALGFELRQPGPWRLTLVTDDGTTWQAGPSEGDSAGWRLSEAAGSLGHGPSPLVVVVSATHDIGAVVTRHRAGAGAARATLSISPEAGAGRASVDPLRANALAATIAGAIRTARRRYDTDETHLYLACPWPLAALLGHHLASSGPVLSFEANPSRDGYLPACRLT